MTYKTKQKDLILEFIKSKKSGHISAENIIDHFKKLAEKDSSISVSKSTVYRALDAMCKDGILTKYVIDEKQGACYSLNDSHCESHNHYHLRCNECDKVFHVDGKDFDEMSSRIKKEVGFDIDTTKTVLYGTCEKCKNKKENKKK